MQQYSNQGASNFPTQTATTILRERGPGDFVKIKWATSLGPPFLATVWTPQADLDQYTFRLACSQSGSPWRTLSFRPSHSSPMSMDLTYSKIFWTLRSSNWGASLTEAGLDLAEIELVLLLLVAGGSTSFSSFVDGEDLVLHDLDLRLLLALALALEGRFLPPSSFPSPFALPLVLEALLLSWSRRVMTSSGGMMRQNWFDEAGTTVFFNVHPK